MYGSGHIHAGRELHGSDSFYFKTNDGIFDSYTVGTVSITVTPIVPVNVAPTADDNSIEVNREVATTIALSAWDADGGALSFTIASSRAHGMLGDIGTPTCFGSTCTADVTYTSDIGHTGTDSFTFTTHDGALDSAAGTISISVPAPPNQEPWAEDVKDMEYWLDPPGGVTITLRGYDSDGDSLEFSIDNQPDYGSLDPIGSPSCDGTSGSMVMGFAVDAGGVGLHRRGHLLPRSRLDRPGVLHLHGR